MADSARTADKYLDYRARLTALVARDDTVIFTGVHPEGQPAALWRVVTDKGELETAPLPCGGVALALSETHVFLAGDDGQLYRAPAAGGAPEPIGEAFTKPVKAMALVDDTRLAVLIGADIHLVSADGAITQTLILPENGSALAVDPGGQWIAAGTVKGTLMVFDEEDRDAFVADESAKVHDGEITALAFEPDELRVMSCGTDGKLLVTHVRGRLEPEDRGGRHAHSGAVRAFLEGAEDRYYTAGDEGQIYTWTRGVRRKPVLLKDNTRPIVAMDEVTYRGRPHVACACEDGAIRLFARDAGGKVESSRALSFHDAYAKARRAFRQKEAATRQEAMQALAGYNDAPSIKLLADRASEDDQHSLKVKAVELLGGTGNRRAVEPLESLLRASTEGVRRAALTSLRGLVGLKVLRPLELALDARRADIGVEAVKALSELATEDDLAMARLVRALDDNPRPVRVTALECLEGIHGKSPEADLIALKSDHADLRAEALLRFFQREMLGESMVLRAIRRATEDDAAAVRQRAFHVAVLSQPTMAAALRHLDKDLHRHLHQIETAEAFNTAEPEKKGKAKAKAKGKKDDDAEGEAAEKETLPKTKKIKPSDLSDEDFRPLLEALASRALDTCVRGAVHLAHLEDARAFGTLLQLSREDENATRVDAARAMEALGDPRALQRLRMMLRDSAAQVRDASFTALSRLLSSEPLEAAEAGLRVEHEDIRRRGLSLLVRTLKKGLPKDLDDPAYALLEQALNDTSSTVRQEAFKAAINLQVAGGGDDTLKFALRSLHADIRREVLTEAMGEIAKPWAWPLVLDFLDDPDSGLRKEAFDFAKKKTKGKTIEPLARSLASSYVDMRSLAVDALGKWHNAKARAHLIEALADVEHSIREAATRALAADADTPAGAEALMGALGSEHDDVRVEAAASLAAGGEPATLKPLVDWLGTERPRVSELASQWDHLTTRALEGLSELEDASAVEAIVPHLQADSAEVRQTAALALAWCAPADDPSTLKAALRHEDAEVRMRAAMGLAWLGDATASSMFFSQKTEQSSSGGRRRRRTTSSSSSSMSVSNEQVLQAAVALGAEDQLLALLNITNVKARNLALRVLMLNEWREDDGEPDRCLSALSTAHPAVRLTAARALEVFGDLSAFGDFVVELINERTGDEKPWTITAETVTDLAEALTFGAPRLRVRALAVVSELGQSRQTGFNKAWRRFSARYADDLEALRKAAKKRKPAKPAYSEADLRQLVFGALTGLARQLVAAPRVRQQAVARIEAMATAGHCTTAEATAVLIAALGDPHGLVRVRAFEGLETLKVGVPVRAAEALATGHSDVGVKGLEALAGASGASGGEKVLAEVMLTNEEGLEFEAMKLLASRTSVVNAAEQALEARSGGLRRQATSDLARAMADKLKGATEALEKATASRFKRVRVDATVALANHQQASAWEPALKLLADDDRNTQNQAINAIARLGDGRGPGALLDRVDNDPAGSALTDNLFSTAGRFRRTEDFERLVAYLTHKKLRRYAFSAALTVTGYDQRLGVDFQEVDNGEPDDEKWLEGQHPRHDALLSALVEATWARGMTSEVERLLGHASWAKGSEVDTPLSPLLKAPQESLRRRAVTTVGWRLRHREGPAEGLVAGLEHADSITGFLCAEALALGGRAEGISLLLSAVDLMEDLSLRQRAVVALGRLGDARALDTLLRLVTEDGHALQEEAAEAIGRLSSGDQAERIFVLLKRLAAEDTGVGLQALTGLRWFGSEEAWAVIRERISSDDWSTRERVASLLGHNDDEATRAILAKVLKEEDDIDVFQAAVTSLRHHHGADSLEPDYLILVAPLVGEYDGFDDLVDRLAGKGDPARLLAALPKIDDDYVEELAEPLIAALLGRPELPVKAAAEALGAPQDRTVAAAARILGRAAGDARSHGKALIEAAGKANAALLEVQKAIDADRNNDWNLRRRREGALDRYRWILWALGRQEAGAEAIITAVNLTGAPARPVRREAVFALTTGMGGKKGLDALEAAATGADAELRVTASEALTRLDPKRAAKLIEGALDDRAALDRLLAKEPKEAEKTLRDAAGKLHTQGVTLPHLIARGDVKGLAAAATDGKLPEPARMGALEGLARIATEEAEKPILKVATDDKQDEALRKAAWRALRRARRARAAREKGDADSEVSR